MDILEKLARVADDPASVTAEVWIEAIAEIIGQMLWQALCEG